ncbi:MAG: glutaredoxin family protein [bacterium]|nr:glutaredoxin family protein [bacterium]
MSGGGPVLLYTRTGCPHSDVLRAELAARGMAITEIDVARRRDAVPELLKLTGGRRVVPVLVDGATITVAPHGGTAF